MRRVSALISLDYKALGQIFQFTHSMTMRYVLSVDGQNQINSRELHESAHQQDDQTPQTTGQPKEDGNFDCVESTRKAEGGNKVTHSKKKIK